MSNLNHKQVPKVRTKVCRRLFNEDTKENTSLLTEEYIRKQLADKIKKWNFDFSTDAPLEGEWEWSRLRD